MIEISRHEFCLRYIKVVAAIKDKTVYGLGSKYVNSLGNVLWVLYNYSDEHLMSWILPRSPEAIYSIRTDTVADEGRKIIIGLTQTMPRLVVCFDYPIEKVSSNFKEEIIYDESMNMYIILQRKPDAYVCYVY